MKILKIADRIKYLLEINEKYRDDDNLLIAKIFWDSINQSETMSAIQFLTLLRDGMLPHTESITRARRKVQEENIHLRGESYKYKKTIEQENVKEELGYGRK